MSRRFLMMFAAGLAISLAPSAFAQESGQYVCEQDLDRMANMYRDRVASLSPADRTEAERLMQVARDQCAQGAPGALSTRSKEATALLQKLESVPPSSQATVPPAR